MSKIRVRANINLSWLRRGQEAEVDATGPYLGLVAAGYLTDLSPAWTPPPTDEPEPLEANTKAELTELAESMGVDVASSWTKAEIIEEIENATPDLG